MALSIAFAGGANSTTDNTTLAILITETDIAVGTMLLVTVAAANTGTNGVARTATVADDAASSTNVYTQRGTTGNQTAGTAGDGASQFFFECPVTTALTALTHTITVTFSGNVAQKAGQVFVMTPAGGESVIHYATGTASVSAGPTTHDAATVSVPNTYSIFGHAAIETDDTVTGDADTTNGNWSTISTQLGDGGNDAASMTSSVQVKTATATGDQSWACTTAVGRDSARNYIIYYSGTPAVAVGLLNTMIRTGCVIGVP